MNCDDLLDVAQALLVPGTRRVFLRRSVSTTYYAMFHALANCCADSLIGASGHHTNRSAWRDTYRALDHGQARTQCQKISLQSFSAPVVEFANLFVVLQSKRHDADYDSYARFYRSECLRDIDEARRAIDALKREPTVVRRAFAAFVLIKRSRRA